MNLTDKEILELSDLCSGLVDETLSEKQKARLATILSTSEEARQFYVRTTGLSSSLYSYASEMQTGERDAAPSRTNVIRAWWIFGLLSAAAVVVLAFWINQPGPNVVSIPAS